MVFFTGTGTEIGKTWAAAELARTLRGRGWRVAARKPVQSYDPADADPIDAAVLAEATRQQAHDVCPPERSYPVPLAPPMAAARLDEACPSLDELARACRFDPGVEIGLVEGVGGLYSPLARDGHNRDLIDRIEPELVVIVASGDLGAIHDITACTIPLAERQTAVFLNRFDPHAETQRLNRDWLRACGLDVAASLQELADIVSGVIADASRRG